LRTLTIVISCICRRHEVVYVFYDIEAFCNSVWPVGLYLWLCLTHRTDYLRSEDLLCNFELEQHNQTYC